MSNGRCLLPYNSTYEGTLDFVANMFTVHESTNTFRTCAGVNGVFQDDSTPSNGRAEEGETIE